MIRWERAPGPEVRYNGRRQSLGEPDTVIKIVLVAAESPQQDHNFLGARYAGLQLFKLSFGESRELGLIKRPIDQLVIGWLVFFLKQHRVAVNVDGCMR